MSPEELALLGLNDMGLPMAPVTPAPAAPAAPSGPVFGALGTALPNKGIDLLARAIQFYGRPTNLVANLAQDAAGAATLPGDVATGKVQLPSRGGVPGSAPEEAGQTQMQPNAVFGALMPEGATWEAPGHGSPFGRTFDLAGFMVGTPGGESASAVGSGVRVPGKAAALPMDNASRLARARELGFNVDEPLYHGSGASFPSLRPGRLNDSTHTPHETPAMFLTSDPALASEYAASAAKGRVEKAQEIYARHGRDAPPEYFATDNSGKVANDRAMALRNEAAALVPDDHSSARLIKKLITDGRDIEWLELAKEFGQAKSDRIRELMRLSNDVYEYYPKGSQVYPVMARGNIMDVDTKIFGGSFNELMYDQLLKRAKDQGFDGIKFRNVVDSPSGRGDAADVVAMFKPSDVRSKFAAFDPANKDSGFLLGSGSTDKRTSAVTFGSLNLPMDEASRIARARELGYDPSQRFFHETKSANVPGIEQSGFDLSKVGARATDEQMPNGVFLKRDPRSIGVGGTEESQIPLVTKNMKLREFESRDDLRRYLKRDDEYAKIVSEQSMVDSHYDGLFRELEKKAWTRKETPESIAAQKQLDDVLAEWRAKTVDVSTRARARATDLLKADGFEGIRVAKDAGGLSGKNMVDTTVVFDPTKLRSTAAAFDPANEGKGFLLGSGSTKPGSAASAISIANAARETPSFGSLNAPIRAYHGSPYDFDKFDLGKINTGEGAQSYGHGLYFAENPKVAEEYRKNVTGSALVAPRRSFLGQELVSGTPQYHAATLLETMGKTLPGVRKEVQGWIANAKPGEDIAHYQAVLETLNRAESKRDFKTLPRQGRMYEVNLNAPADRFLDWDRPLTQQAAPVREAATAIMKKKSPWLDELPDMGGSDLYHMPGYVGRVGNTETWRDAGIPGIKYLDQGSRLNVDLSNAVSKLPTGKWQVMPHWQQKFPDLAKPFATKDAAVKALDTAASTQGTRNFVVFDPEIIQIVRKYGLTGLLGAGALTDILGNEAQAAP